MELHRLAGVALEHGVDRRALVWRQRTVHQPASEPAHQGDAGHDDVGVRAICSGSGSDRIGRDRMAHAGASPRDANQRRCADADGFS
jgi:hypothetical protein